MQLVEKAQQLQVTQATKREDEITIIGLRREMEKGAARADMLSVREKAAQKLVADLQHVRKIASSPRNMVAFAMYSYQLPGFLAFRAGGRKPAIKTRC